MQNLIALSHKLNEKTNTINSTISSLNENLARLNLGVEAWLDCLSLEAEAYEEHSETETCARSRTRDEKVLGYCRVENEWQLAVRKATRVIYPDSFEDRDYEDDILNPTYYPLLKASRHFRAKAVTQIPALLDQIGASVMRLLSSIEIAEKAVGMLSPAQDVWESLNKGVRTADAMKLRVLATEAMEKGIRASNTLDQDTQA